MDCINSFTLYAKLLRSAPNFYVQKSFSKVHLLACMKSTRSLKPVFQFLKSSHPCKIFRLFDFIDYRPWDKYNFQINFYGFRVSVVSSLSLSYNWTMVPSRTGSLSQVLRGYCPASTPILKPVWNRSCYIFYYCKQSSQQLLLPVPICTIALILINFLSQMFNFKKKLT